MIKFKDCCDCEHWDIVNASWGYAMCKIKDEETQHDDTCSEFIERGSDETNR